MTRTLRLKLFYPALIILIAAAVIGIVSALPSDDRVTALLAIAVLAFLPGRIHASVYRDFYRGRRMLGADRPRKALHHFRAFLANLDRRPWKKKLIWLSWSFYTVDAAAMAWNGAVKGTQLEEGFPLP